MLEIRANGDAESVNRFIDSLDLTKWQVLRRSKPYRNRHGDGVRVYLVLEGAKDEQHKR